MLKEQFQLKVNEWYGKCLERCELVNQTEQDAIVFVAHRGMDKVLRFDIARVFSIGNQVETSVDKSVDGLDMTKVFELMQAVVRGL